MRIGVWNSKKPCAFMRLRSEIDHRPAQHDVAVQPLAAQVEEAVAQPRFFGVFLIAEHLERQFPRRPQHLESR